MKQPTELVDEPDPDGRPVVHHRTVDTLGIMLRAGTITEEMHDAGCRFRAAFANAHIGGVRCMPLTRGYGGLRRDHTAAQLDARRYVVAALAAVGGVGSIHGSCLWYVVGAEASVREWRMRRAWTGQPVSPRSAARILVEVLGVLVDT